jgi:hypothetical protein
MIFNSYIKICYDYNFQSVTRIIDFIQYIKSSISYDEYAYNILWHLDPMIGNESEISKYTTAAAR